jgi:hypothetical protein
MHTQVIQNGGTLRLADLAGFAAIELHTTTDGRRVHVAAFTAAELAEHHGVRVPQDCEPAAPTVEDYRAGFAARERWERERHGITPCGADRAARGQRPRPGGARRGSRGARKARGPRGRRSRDPHHGRRQHRLRRGGLTA